MAEKKKRHPAAKWIEPYEDMSPRDLAIKRWGIALEQFAAITDEFDLPVYRLMGKLLTRDRDADVLDDPHDELRVLGRDIETFEDEHWQLIADLKAATRPPKEKQTTGRISKQDRMLCRTIALRWLHEDPKVSMIAVIRSGQLEEACEGRTYTEGTYRRWFKNLSEGRNEKLEFDSKTGPREPHKKR